GRRAFTGDDPASVRAAILNGTRAPLHQLNPEQPARLEKVVKCLERDPTRRYQHAADLRNDLVKLRRERENPLGRPWVLATAAATVIAVMVVAGFLLHWQREKRQFRSKDTIVLADFNDMTHTSNWDVTLQRALSDELEQSTYLNVLSEDRVQQIL